MREFFVTLRGDLIELERVVAVVKNQHPINRDIYPWIVHVSARTEITIFVSQRDYEQIKKKRGVRLC